MREQLKKKWAKYTGSFVNLFTVLLLACAFCGRCAFRNDPSRGMAFKKVAPVGACWAGLPARVDIWLEMLRRWVILVFGALW